MTSNWLKAQIDMRDHEEEIIAYVRDRFTPGYVFSDDELTDWALFHGFVEVSEDE